MKEVIHSTQAPKAIGTYSQAIKSGNFLFTSGQVGINPETGKLVRGGIKEETRQVLRNLKHVINAAGLDFKDVVKVTVFLDDIDNFSVYNDVYSDFFDGEPPARSTCQVDSLPLEAMIEIEMIVSC